MNLFRLFKSGRPEQPAPVRYTPEELATMDNEVLSRLAQEMASKQSIGQACVDTCWHIVQTLEERHLRVPLDLLPAPRNDREFLAMWFDTKGGQYV